MPFIEAPTTFYLGRQYEPSSQRLTEDVVYYDARDLVTHAIVVGMTGSGKTGLCITLLEEAILDNIPAIIIDPKGDITNLLLTFPDFRPEDFEPWVNADDARRAGLDLKSYAADVANRWKDGLSSWGVVPDRLRWMKGIARYSIYTPGSDAGLPVSILASLAAPREGWAGNEEGLREKISGIVTALLALIGMNVEPVKSKEHVLISNIFEYAWQRGINLTMEDIILQVQKPPFTKLGVLQIDDYMSEKARTKLAMDLNNIIASPSFQSWLQGDSLNIQNLLYQPDGRARVSIFYIAHLNEAERQFMITLLLENVNSWLRTQSGTTSLRALLYIDEMFGYFPPYPKNPPTKDPILRLLKQARAFGLGLILATQNPGDLDYKGLSNAGTWFIGRLQSDNDKQRVMAGLESLASADSNLNLRDVEKLISDIEPRVFLMHNVHDTTGPVLVHTRWAMSYLRGPLTRQQVQILMAGQKQELMARLAASGQLQPAYNTQSVAAQNLPLPPVPGATQGMPPLPPETGGFGAQSLPPMPPLPSDGGFQQGFTQQATMPANQVNFSQAMPQGTGATMRGPSAPAGFSANPPPLPSSTPQFFIPAAMTSQQALTAWEQQTHVHAANFGGSSMAYKPVVLAQAIVRYQDKKSMLYTARVYSYQIPTLEKAGIIHWEEFATAPLDARRLSGEPLSVAIYGDLTPGMTDAKRMTALRNELVDMLYNTGRLVLPFNQTLGVYASPDADPSIFPAQVQQVAREKRDAEIDQLAAKYEKLMDQLDDKLRREERELSADKRELADIKREELFTKGEALLSLLKGRTTYTLSRSSRATRYRNQSKASVSESEQTINELQDKLEATQQKFEQEIAMVNDKWAKTAATSQDYVITPYKKDIQVELFGIGWLPFYYTQVNGQAFLLPGY
jgi:hypothetical protein